VLIVAALPWLVIGYTNFPSGVASALLIRDVRTILILVLSVLAGTIVYQCVLTCLAGFKLFFGDSLKAGHLAIGRLMPEPKDTRVRGALEALRAADKSSRPTKELEAVGAIGASIQRVAGQVIVGGVTTLDELQKELRHQTGEFTTDRHDYFDRIKFLLDRTQCRINDEYAHVSSRTGWLLTSQAFLLTGFVATVNADRIGALPKHWIAFVFCVTGAVFSFVLALGLFYGFSIIDKLKRQRAEIEKVAHAEFGIPSTGVNEGRYAHVSGHAASKFVPTYAYLAWVILAILVATRFGEMTQGEIKSVLWPTGEAVAFSTGGMARVSSSPVFSVGEWEFRPLPDKCPGTPGEPDKWIEDVAKQWSQRNHASPDDVLLLVGGADRLRLRPALSREFDTNIGLARRRAQHVQDRLVDLTKHLDDSDVAKLRPDRIRILVAGPSAPSLPGRPSAADDGCKDRVVQVWMPGLN
jgi:hypothetical protein